MMQPANPIDFGGAVTPATRAKHAPQLDPPATRTVSKPQRDVSGRTIGGLIGGAHNWAYTAMIGYGCKCMGIPSQPIHG
jgi:hypothetical protein